MIGNIGKKDKQARPGRDGNRVIRGPERRSPDSLVDEVEDDILYFLSQSRELG